MREFEINVFNLRAYTEGKIEGEVFRLPMNQEELQRRLRELLGKDEEYMISAWEIPREWGFLENVIGEYSSPMELNMLAHLLQNQEINREAVSAYAMAMRDQDMITEIEMGNLLLQSEEIPYYHYDFNGMETADFSEEEKYGYTIAKNNGLRSQLQQMGIDNYMD